MNKYIKKRFIDAYIYCYGATKKEAEAVYKTASPEYIYAVIESAQQDGRKAFYND